MVDQDRDWCSYFLLQKGIELLKKNGNHQLLISFLVNSEKREKLLLLLSDGPKTLSEIREYLGVSSSGIIPEIRKLEEKMLIYKDNRSYFLTEMGIVVAEYICQFEWVLQIFNMNTKFWDEHNISAIPIEFRLRIHELGNYEIIKSIPNDIFRPQNEYLKNLLNAKWMKGVSSVLNPEYPEYVLNLAMKGMPVSLIVTSDLLQTIKDKCEKELELGKNCTNACVMVCDEKIEVSFAVTDFFLSLRLFQKDGTYDFYQNIISFERSAVKWGEDLFRYYEKRSKKVRLDDL